MCWLSAQLWVLEDSRSSRFKVSRRVRSTVGEDGTLELRVWGLCLQAVGWAEIRSILLRYHWSRILCARFLSAMPSAVLPAMRMDESLSLDDEMITAVLASGMLINGLGKLFGGVLIDRRELARMVGAFHQKV